MGTGSMGTAVASYDDVIIGAYQADPAGITSAGSSYIVYGKDNIRETDERHRSRKRHLLLARRQSVFVVFVMGLAHKMLHCKED